MATHKATTQAASSAERTRGAKASSLRNIICASHPTTDAHWLPLPARSAAARLAHAPPAIVAKSNRRFLCGRAAAEALIRAWDRSFWQAFAVACNLAGRGDPQPITMPYDVSDGIPEGAQAERLANDERMQRNREHKRVFARLLQHLIELVDDHLGELPSGVPPINERG